MSIKCDIESNLMISALHVMNDMQNEEIFIVSLSMLPFTEKIMHLYVYI